MSNSPILITGASGFLASHIILKLLQQGETVRGSVRSRARGDNIREVLENHGADTAKLSFVALDLMSDDGWDAAMEGVKTLIHTASPFITHIPKDEDEVIRPAVEGTERALNAALKSGVKRIVLTSSEVAINRGHDKSRTMFTGADWSNPNATGVTPYMKSKTLAEQRAWEIMDDADRHNDLSVVNPGFILGPLLEKDMGTSGAILHKMLGGKFPGAPDLWFTTVDVRDAADLHILAMTDKSTFGQRLPAAHGIISFGDMARAMAAEFPTYARALPTRNLPNIMVRLVGLFDRDARSSVSMLGQKLEIDHQMAEKLLGRPLIDGKHAALAMAKTLIDQKLV